MLPSHIMPMHQWRADMYQFLGPDPMLFPKTNEKILSDYRCNSWNARTGNIQKQEVELSLVSLKDFEKE